MFEAPELGELVFGLRDNLLGLMLAARGGWSAFERLMQAGVAVLIVALVATALQAVDEGGAMGRGACLPRFPDQPGASGTRSGSIG